MLYVGSQWANPLVHCWGGGGGGQSPQHWIACEKIFEASSSPRAAMSLYGNTVKSWSLVAPTHMKHQLTHVVRGATEETQAVSHTLPKCFLRNMREHNLDPPHDIPGAAPDDHIWHMPRPHLWYSQSGLSNN